MGKPLFDMTLYELWQLFPIIIEKHNPLWKEYYEEEAKYIAGLIGNAFPYEINQVGSTSIKDIAAKPIIDILLEVNLCDINELLS